MYIHLLVKFWLSTLNVCLHVDVVDSQRERFREVNSYLFCPFNLKFYNQSLRYGLNQCIIFCTGCLMAKLHLIPHGISYDVEYITFRQ